MIKTFTQHYEDYTYYKANITDFDAKKAYAFTHAFNKFDNV